MYRPYAGTEGLLLNHLLVGFELHWQQKPLGDQNIIELVTADGRNWVVEASRLRIIILFFVNSPAPRRVLEKRRRTSYPHDVLHLAAIRHDHTFVRPKTAVTQPCQNKQLYGGWKSYEEAEEDGQLVSKTLELYHSDLELQRSSTRRPIYKQVKQSPDPRYAMPCHDSIVPILSRITTVF